MKKIFLLSVMFVIATGIFAQNNSNYIADNNKSGKWLGEVSVLWSLNDDNDVSGGSGISANFGYLFFDRLYTGIGGGISWMSDNNYIPNSFKYHTFPVFCDVKYYIPVCKALSVFAATDIGYNFYEQEAKEQHIADPGHFLISPFAGASYRIWKSLSVNLSVGGRFEKYNMFIIRAGFVF